MSYVFVFFLYLILLFFWIIAAIEGDATQSLSDTYDASTIPIDGGYDGPHPSMEKGLLGTSDMELEDKMFEPGRLPIDFVMVSSMPCCCVCEFGR